MTHFRKLSIWLTIGRRNINFETSKNKRHSTIQGDVKSIRIEISATRLSNSPLQPLPSSTIQQSRKSFVNIRVIFVDIRYAFEVPTPAGDLLWPSNWLKEEMKLPTVFEGVE